MEAHQVICVLDQEFGCFGVQPASLSEADQWGAIREHHKAGGFALRITKRGHEGTQLRRAKAGGGGHDQIEYACSHD
jgi:hypothetical protein